MEAARGAGTARRGRGASAGGVAQRAAYLRPRGRTLSPRPGEPPPARSEARGHGGMPARDNERKRVNRMSQNFTDANGRFRRQVVTNLDTGKGGSGICTYMILEAGLGVIVFSGLCMAFCLFGTIEFIREVRCLNGEKLPFYMVLGLVVFWGLGGFGVYFYRTFGWLLSWLTFTETEVIWRCPFRKTRRIPREECRYAGIHQCMFGKSERTGQPAMGVKAFISTKPYPGYANISLLKNTDEFVTGFVTYRLCKVLSEWLPDPQNRCFISEAARMERDRRGMRRRRERKRAERRRRRMKKREQ